MKKIICSILFVALTLLNALSVSAATTETKDYKLLGTETLPTNVLRVTKFGTNLVTTMKVRLTGYADDKSTVIFVPENDTPVDTVLSSIEGYSLWTYLDGTGNKYTRDMFFSKTGGTYEKIRIKLSDFSNYFNKDGTHTEHLFDDVHNYNFTNEGDGHTSSLVFICGGYVTFAAPDKDGYVEIYASTNIGEEVDYKTYFRYNNISGASAYGSLSGLLIGETDGNNYVSVTDATYL